MGAKNQRFWVKKFLKKSAICAYGNNKVKKKKEKFFK